VGVDVRDDEMPARDANRAIGILRATIGLAASGRIVEVAGELVGIVTVVVGPVTDVDEIGEGHVSASIARVVGIVVEDDDVVSGPQKLVKVGRVLRNVRGVGAVHGGREVRRVDVGGVDGEVHTTGHESVVNLSLDDGGLVQRKLQRHLPLIGVQWARDALDDGRVELSGRQSFRVAWRSGGGAEFVGGALRIESNLGREADTLVHIGEGLMSAVVLEELETELIATGLDQLVDRLLVVAAALRHGRLVAKFIDQVEFEVNVDAMGRHESAEVARLGNIELDLGALVLDVHAHVVTKMGRIAAVSRLESDLVERRWRVVELARNETILLANRLHHDGGEGNGERKLSAAADDGAGGLRLKDLERVGASGELQSLDLVAVEHVFASGNNVGVVIEDADNEVGSDRVIVVGVAWVDEIRDGKVQGRVETIRLLSVSEILAQVVLRTSAPKQLRGREGLGSARLVGGRLNGGDLHLEVPE